MHTHAVLNPAAEPFIPAVAVEVDLERNKSQPNYPNIQSPQEA